MLPIKSQQQFLFSRIRLCIVFATTKPPAILFGLFHLRAQLFIGQCFIAVKTNLLQVDLLALTDHKRQWQPTVFINRLFFHIHLSQQITLFKIQFNQLIHRPFFLSRANQLPRNKTQLALQGFVFNCPIAFKYHLTQTRHFNHNNFNRHTTCNLFDKYLHIGKQTEFIEVANHPPSFIHCQCLPFK